MQRKQLTVLSADVVGYSALMKHAEVETHIFTTRSIDRADAFFKQHGGTMAQQATGDGLLYVFHSSAHAVEAASKFLHSLITHPLQMSNGENLRYRIGIHCGNVLVTDKSYTGNTVNIASRLESIAKPLSMQISESVFHALPTVLKGQFSPVQPKALKNIREDVRSYTFSPNEDASQLQLLPQPWLSHPGTTPTVTTFVSSSNLQRKIYDQLKQIEVNIQFRLQPFSELDICLGLQTSSSAKDLDSFARLCRLDGIRYIILLRYKRVHGSHQEIQIGVLDSLSDRIVCQQVIGLKNSEINSTHQFEIDQLCVCLWSAIQTWDLRKIPNSLSPTIYSTIFKIKSRIRQGELSEILIAIKLLSSMLKNHSENDLAWIELAHAYQLAWRYDTTGECNNFLARSVKIVSNILSRDPMNSGAIRELGYSQLFSRAGGTAIETMRTAVNCNPLDVMAIANLADGYAVTGYPKRSISLINLSLKINREYQSDWRLWSLADAYFSASDYENVVRTVNRMSDPSEGLRLKAASLALVGDDINAKKMSKIIIFKNPYFSVESWRKKQPDSDPVETERYCDGLFKAGLPR